MEGELTLNGDYCALIHWEILSSKIMNNHIFLFEVISVTNETSYSCLDHLYHRHIGEQARFTSRVQFQIGVPGQKFLIGLQFVVPKDVGPWVHLAAQIGCWLFDTARPCFKPIRILLHLKSMWGPYDIFLCPLLVTHPVVSLHYGLLHCNE